MPATSMGSAAGYREITFANQDGVQPLALLGAKVAFESGTFLIDDKVGPQAGNPLVCRHLLAAVNGLSAGRDDLHDQARTVFDVGVARLWLASHHDVRIVERIVRRPYLHIAHVNPTRCSIRGFYELPKDIDRNPVMPLGRAGHGIQ